MTDLELHDVLSRASEGLDAPELVHRAVTMANTRHARRRAVVTSVAACLAVAGLVLVPRALDSTDPVREPTETPDPTPEVTVVPPIDEGVIQETWDPARVAELPVRNRTLLPTDLTPGDSADRTGERVVAVLDDGSRLHVVTDGERWQTLESPEPLIEGRDSAVSPDGQLVMVTGATGLWSRDVDTATWRRVDYPDGFRRTSWERGGVLLPLEGAMTYLAQGDRTWLVDLETGASETQPFPLAPEQATVTSRGVVTLGLDRGTPEHWST
jgi:hypothetical protein